MTTTPAEPLEPVIHLPADEPPADGTWRDWGGAQHDPDVIAEGNRLGETIDVDDDEDNGL